MGPRHLGDARHASGHRLGWHGHRARGRRVHDIVCRRPAVRRAAPDAGPTTRPRTRSAATTRSRRSNAGGRQCWPRIVLGSAGSTIAGDAVTVLDEEACTDDPAHQLVRARTGSIVTWKDSIPWEIASGRMPAVAVLGTQAMPGSPTVDATALEIAYLSEPSGGQRRDGDPLLRRERASHGFPLQPHVRQPADRRQQHRRARRCRARRPRHRHRGAVHRVRRRLPHRVDGGGQRRSSGARVHQRRQRADTRPLVAAPAGRLGRRQLRVAVPAERHDPRHPGGRRLHGQPVRRPSTRTRPRSTGWRAASTHRSPRATATTPASGVQLGDPHRRRRVGARAPSTPTSPGQITGDTPAVIETQRRPRHGHPKLNLLSQAEADRQEHEHERHRAGSSYSDTDGDPSPSP